MQFCMQRNFTHRKCVMTSVTDKPSASRYCGLVRKAGRVDDASRLESGQTLKGLEGSNPSPSAILKREGNITLIIEASQHHPAKIIPFPISTICPTCHRPCSDNELSGCMTCGAKYCKHDKWTCECDTESKLFSILPHFIQDALS